MSEKILSISVAAYNVEKYLVKLFEFLNISPEVNQKIEVIIVNDGSTDKTLEIANRFKSLNILKKQFHIKAYIWLE